MLPWPPPCCPFPGKVTSDIQQETYSYSITDANILDNITRCMYSELSLSSIVVRLDSVCTLKAIPAAQGACWSVPSDYQCYCPVGTLSNWSCSHGLCVVCGWYRVQIMLTLNKPQAKHQPQQVQLALLELLRVCSHMFSQLGSLHDAWRCS